MWMIKSHYLQTTVVVTRLGLVQFDVCTPCRWHPLCGGWGRLTFSWKSRALCMLQLRWLRRTISVGHFFLQSWVFKLASSLLSSLPVQRQEMQIWRWVAVGWFLMAFSSGVGLEGMGAPPESKGQALMCGPLSAQLLFSLRFVPGWGDQCGLTLNSVLFSLY